MLTQLEAVNGATVVMDAGLATEANLLWLTQHGYHYIVVSRRRNKTFDASQATEVMTAGNRPIQVQRVNVPDSNEIELHCFSPDRAKKDQAIDTTKLAPRVKHEGGASGLDPRGYCF
jgi:hypothetical protein